MINGNGEKVEGPFMYGAMASDVDYDRPSPLARQVAGDHYKNYKFQPIEFINANNIGFAAGSVIKYVCRYKDKGGLDDLKKAKHFIELLAKSEYDATI